MARNSSCSGLKADAITGHRLESGDLSRRAVETKALWRKSKDGIVALRCGSRVPELDHPIASTIRKLVGYPIKIQTGLVE